MVNISDIMDSFKYCEMLGEDFLQSSAENLGENWTFQQDYAFCHCSTHSKN